MVKEAPEQASVPLPTQDLLVILTPSTEVDIPGGSQQIPPPVGSTSQANRFPFPPQFIKDKEQDEAWGKILNR